MMTMAAIILKNIDKTSWHLLHIEPTLNTKENYLFVY